MDCFNHLHPGILPMLSGLKARGIRIGLITNCFSEEAKLIRESELFGVFLGGNWYFLLYRLLCVGVGLDMGSVHKHNTRCISAMETGGFSCLHRLNYCRVGAVTSNTHNTSQTSGYYGHRRRRSWSF